MSLEERGVRRCGDISSLVMLVMATMVGVSLLVVLTILQTFGEDSSLHSLSYKAVSQHTLLPPRPPHPDKRMSPIALPPHRHITKRQAYADRQGWKEEEGKKPASHQLPCSKAETWQAACFKGECYALDLGGLRSPFCQCPELYEGPRCELRTAYFYLAEMKRAAVIGGIVFGVVAIIVAISVYCTCRKRRRQRKRVHENVDVLDNTKDTDVPDASKDNVI